MSRLKWRDSVQYSTCVWHLLLTVDNCVNPPFTSFRKRSLHFCQLFQKILLSLQNVQLFQNKGLQVTFVHLMSKICSDETQTTQGDSGFDCNIIAVLKSSASAGKAEFTLKFESSEFHQTTSDAFKVKGQFSAGCDSKKHDSH